MAIAYRASNTIKETASAASIESNSFTVNAGDFLWVVVSNASDQPTGVVWDASGTNQSLTLVYSVNAGGRRTSIYRHTAPTTGAHTATATWAGSQSAPVIVVRAFTGVDTTTPTGIDFDASGSSTTPSVTNTGDTAGGVNVAEFVSAEDYVSFTATNGTEQDEQVSANWAVVCLTRAGGTNIQINGTYGGSTAWNATVVELETAAAPSGKMLNSIQIGSQVGVSPINGPILGLRHA